MTKSEIVREFARKRRAAVRRSNATRYSNGKRRAARKMPQLIELKLSLETFVLEKPKRALLEGLTQ